MDENESAILIGANSSLVSDERLKLTSNGQVPDHHGAALPHDVAELHQDLLLPVPQRGRD